MNSWFMEREFTLKEKRLIGLKMEDLNLNGLK